MSDQRHVSFSCLVDEATEEIISNQKKNEAVECYEDETQVMNVIVEGLQVDMEDKVRFSMKVRLNYKYRKELKLALLGCRMKVVTRLRNTSASSVRSLLQKRLNMICESNYVISINMFCVNVNQLINSCRWINYVEDIHPICTLYHVMD
uniref:U1-2 protein n=1 Tax=Milk vetch chlorotic dwarf virus TaxID=2683340 RepID=A0A650FZ33_9VIRU|nr:U1-2 protein [Milk vetch chlorotic dwarf virus]